MTIKKSLAILLFLQVTSLYATNSFAYGTATIEQVEENGVSLAAGGGHSCALTGDNVTCWGDNKYGQTNVPPLTHPTQVSAGYEHTCALDNSGVTCWGFDRYGQTNVPPLSHPTQISAAGWYTCALDDSGVKCWGDNSYGQTNVPPLSHPTQITAGVWCTCAVDDSGVKCWGDNKYGQTNVPPLSYPTQITAGGWYTCTLDDSGVKCWGANKYGQTDVPSLNHPTHITSGFFHTCAVDDSGVKCWGDNAYGQTNVPPLSHPTQIAAGGWYTCALDDSGVKCWGYNEAGQTKVPDFDYIFFALSSLEKSYESLAKRVYRDKAVVLNELAKSVAEYKVSDQNSQPLATSYRAYSARLFSLEIIQDLLVETHSEYVETKILPNIQQSLDEWSTKLGIPSLNDFEPSSQTINIALAITQSSLQAIKQNLPENLQQEVTTLLVPVAQAKAVVNDSPRQAAVTLRDILNAHSSLLATLVQDQNTIGFGKMLIAIQGYLNHRSL